jgi:hypothetical protein
MGRRTWIKIFSEKWLRGSIREENIETRATWIDLLVLAADSVYGDNGTINVAPGEGLTDSQIAAIFRISTKSFAKIKQRLIKKNRIIVNKKNEIVITNWNKYQSEYARQARYRKGYNQKLQPKVTTKSYTLEERREKREVKERILCIFEYWQKILNHPQAKLTNDRRGKIANRLKEGYSVDDLKRTIDGCKASSYHMGDNEHNKVYDSIELLFRNGDKVEQFWSYLREDVKGDLPRLDRGDSKSK